MEKDFTELTEKGEAFPILDSKLISATKKVYDIKLIDCGEYCQVYLYDNRKVIKDSSFDSDELELKKKKIDGSSEEVEVSKEKKKIKLSNTIEEKNIIRSKLECQRLAKANINDWKTFITLTFEENITDVGYANKRFKYFVDKVRRVKKDFKYLCITEFQKRGATHYHLLSNIDIEDRSLTYLQEDNPKFIHVKYWLEGFNSVEEMTGDVKKVVGYVAKYMTKDIDNRLFNRRRYFYSQNVNIPTKNYIDMTSEKEREFYNKKIQDMEIVYQNEYVNTYDKSNVTFLELKKIH